jgi:hypothetical protein
MIAFFVMSRSPVKRSVSPPRKSPRRREKASPTPRISPKLAAFVRQHWPARGRAERIVRARKAWEEAMKIASTFKKVDAETIKWIAEDPDLEYL